MSTKKHRRRKKRAKKSDGLNPLVLLGLGAAVLYFVSQNAAANGATGATGNTDMGGDNFGITSSGW